MSNSVTPVAVRLSSSPINVGDPSNPPCCTCAAAPTPNGVDWSATSNTIQLVNSSNASPRRTARPRVHVSA